MKLRIRGNSLRIRVSQSELEQISNAGSAEDAVRFSSDEELRYSVVVRPDGEVGAVFSGKEVQVLLPQPKVARWVRADEVSIEGEQDVGDGETLNILIEKDFVCLAPREGEDDSDLFPNPIKVTD